MWVDPVTQVMHQSGQNDRSVLLGCEWDLFSGKRRDMILLVCFHECLHLQITKVGGSTTVLKSVMRRSWKDVVIGSELQNIFESLHCWLVDDGPAVIWKDNWPVNYILQMNRLWWSHGARWVVTFLLLDFEVTCSWIVLRLPSLKNVICLYHVFISKLNFVSLNI